MERSDWPDDESPSSPVPPPERRAWRHPSELGRNPAALPTPGCARPRSNRLAIAVAASTAGTLAIASIGVAAFSRDHHRTTTTSLEASNADALTVSFVLPRTTQASDALTTLARITSTVDSATATQGTDNASAGNTSTNPGSSRPPAVITLSRPGHAGDDVAAVVTDAGAVWAVAEDVTGADHLEVATIDGDMVKVTVGRADPETGLVELHPTKPIAAQPSGPVTWLGVNCSDEYIEPSTTPPSSPAANDAREPAATANVDGQSSLTTISAAGSANGARAGESPAGSTTIATKPTSNPAGRTTTASVGAVTTTIVPTAPVVVAVAAPTTSSVTTTAPADSASGTGGGTKTSRAPAAVPGADAPATTSSPPAHSGSASSPDTVNTTVAGATNDTATNDTTTNDTATNDAATTSDKRSPQPAWPAGEPALGGSHVRGVHVHGVVDASPAATVGLRPGDVILAADGRPVRTVWALVLAVRRHAPGEHLTMLIRRDGSLVEMSAALSRHSPGQA